MKIPDVPSEADEILPWAVDITAAVRALWPQRGGDLIPSIRLNGTTWRLARSQGANSSPALRPFGAVGISLPDSEGGPPTISLLVAKGTVNDLDDGAGLSATGTSGTPPDNAWEFALSPSTTKYGVIKATMETDGTVSAAVLSLETTPSVTAAGDSETGDPPPFAYRKLFKVEVDGDYLITITQYADGAQQAVALVSAWSCSTITKNVVWITP